MLQLLHIENIAVIERADIELEDGLTVLSGETGAGKSIVIDSIGAILGRRVSRDLVRSGAKKGFVSAVFTDLPPALCQLVNELDLPQTSREAVRCTSRRSRIFILSGLSGKRFDEPQLLDVARNRCLRAFIAAVIQLLEQLLLRLNVVVADQLENFLVAF